MDPDGPPVSICMDHWSIFVDCGPYRSRGNWSDEDLQRAMTAFGNGVMGLNKCARQYGVPKSTLKRHLDGKNKTANGFKKLGRNTMLTADLEQQLHDLILDMEGMFFGMTRKDLMELAFEVAEENRLPHPFNREKRSAGKGWYYRFMKRFPDISLRQAEATSVSRASGFNKDGVSRYFDLLEKIITITSLPAGSSR
ncbi:hypothetical protein BaRGS_00023888 [Batillaria attramentaria]|uniref:HTH CENPB-type domain-containing protein n=1 Tax=Batillaria attramentaria TaxID=370345 RepID=A0ABD0KCK8_9CAEN